MSRTSLPKLNTKKSFRIFVQKHVFLFCFSLIFSVFDLLLLFVFFGMEGQ